MYLLAPDHVYKVRVLASSVWVPEVRRWEPEVFIIGESINFTVEDTTRLMQNLHTANVIAEQIRHLAVQGVEAGSHGRSGEAPVSGDKGAWTRMVVKSRRRQGDGVQHVQRNAEHKGATWNAPWHGLGLEAKGTETGRQATRDPKGRATPRCDKEEEWKSKKPDGKESVIPSTRQSWGGEDPPATEIHSGELRPPVIQQQGTTKGSEVRPWTGLWSSPPNGNGAAVTIGCAPATTTRSELSHWRSRG